MTKNEKPTAPKQRSPWAWIPTLYFAEGIPYVVAMTVAVIMFKRFGISNTDIALYTSWLYLPWVIKPLWSPIVDLLKTKRWWIIFMQLVIGASLGAVALSIPLPGFFKISLIFLWLLAFSSATHDIAADGFYMLGLDEHQQAYFVGIRSTFYRIAMITGQGLLIILAGFFEVSTGLPPIEINVSANPTYTKEIQLPEVTQSASTGQTFFAVFPQQAEISTQNIPSSKLDSIRKVVTQYNQDNKFEAHQVENQVKSGAKNESSWWSDYISTPLKNFLKDHFQAKAKSVSGNTLVGNVTVVAIKLSEKPKENKEMVLNVKFRNGDNSIRLLEGERLTFNSGNQDKPAYLLFQCDPKLTRSTQASFKGTSGNIHLAWSITFVILAVMFVIFSFYHRFILPHPKSDQQVISQGENLFSEFFKTFGSFFKRKDIGVIIAFLMLYRVGEAQLIKMASPFMLDPRNLGGLGLTTGDVGLLYGTFGILALTAGGILGGIAASTKGFRYWLWWMVLAINVPHLAYVYMSFAQPENQLIIGLCVVLEQFSYGFGFTAYMLYMIYISEGKNKTAHFAIATGFMALGMMLPGMFSGWLQEIIGYPNFFVWVMLCMIPGMIPVFFINVKPEFGIKKKEE
ncbi:AmpG permease [Aquipluma nitroreducens]|uniref:AmpG permease n=1 Tax=Aquipluma nitroreducens TaxID=2010828 RepID=A0A5K7SDA2_9BACT|nr:MFS transporter [Aquipluma nitroreducens]BBE19548.1 AmpG permease [Aquipluma nitroreducens]